MRRVIKKQKDKISLPVLVHQLATMNYQQLKKVKFIVDSKIKDCDFVLDADQRVFYSEIIKVLKQNNIPYIANKEGETAIPRLRGFNPDDFINAYDKVTGLSREAKISGTVQKMWFYRLCVQCVMDFLKLHKRNYCLQTFVEAYNDLQKFFNDFDSDDEMDSLSEILGKLEIVNRLLPNSLNYSLGIKGLLAGFDHLEEAIDHSFPGYIESGLLPVIVTAFQRKSKTS